MMKDWTLVGVPFEGGAPTPGARGAYAAISRYLKNERPDVLTCFQSIVDLDVDRWRHVDRLGVNAGFTAITNAGRGRALAIGGCHTITYYAVQALRRIYPDLALVFFDAHSDASQTRGEFISHGNFLRNIYRRQPLPIIAIGVRGDEAKLYDLNAVILPAVDVRMPVAAAWLETQLTSLGERPVYLTLDIDVLDPAVCPGVNHPIGGGLMAEELSSLVKLVCKHGIIGADLVEYIPHRDPSGKGLPIIADLMATISSETPAARRVPVDVSRTEGETGIAKIKQNVRELIQLGYESNPDDLVSQYQLLNDSSNPPLAEYFAMCPSTVGITKSLPNVDAREFIVIGGPCLFKTGGNATKVTLRDILDLISPIVLAAHIRCPCLLYFELEESELGEHKASSELLTQYSHLLDVLQFTALAYARRQGLSSADLTFAVTAAPEVDRLLTDTVLRIVDDTPAESLDGLYSIDGRSVFPRDHPFAENLRDVWRRSLASYLPDVVGRLCSRTVSNVIAAENLDQARAIRLADYLATSRLRSGSVFHVAHLSAPGLNGLPMQRCQESNTVYAWPPTEAIQALTRGREEVVEFYSSAWPDTCFRAGDSHRENTVTVLSLFADAIRHCANRSDSLFLASINKPISL